ncbi:MAG: PAS domain S-box protein [Desulfomonilia bacterium]|jgi:PAS domain S-box-containing protein
MGRRNGDAGKMGGEVSSARKGGPGAPGSLPGPAEILDQVDVGILLLDRERRFAYVNARAAELLGRRREDLVGQSLQDVIPPEARAPLKEELDRSARENLPSGFDFLYPGRIPRWLNFRSTPAGPGLVLVIQDVTSRKKAEEKLKESESRYHSLFENNHAVMLLIRPSTGRIVDANRAAEKFYGYTRQQLVSMSITDINILDHDQVMQELRKAESREQGVFFFRHRLSSGEVRDVAVYTGPIQVSGEPLLYSIVHDITEQQQAREKVRRLNEELELKVRERTGELTRAIDRLERQRGILKTIIDNVPVMLAFYDEAGKVALINRELEKVSGWSGEEIPGINLISAIFPDPGYRRRVLRLLEETSPAWNELEMTTRSGETVHASWSMIRIPGGSRVGIGIDQSERRKMELDTMRLVTAVEQSGEGIVIFSPDWVVEYANPAYESMSGYSREELIGRKITSLTDYLGESGFEEIIEHVTTHRREWKGRQKRVRKTTGEDFLISVTVTPVLSREGVITNFIEIVRDITMELRLQDQLFQSQKLEAVGTLAGGIAHDLKNVLGPIVIDAELALMDVPEGHPAHGLLREIMQAARMGKDLVQQIVTFSRREPPEKKPVAIEQVLSEALEFLASGLAPNIEVRKLIHAKGAVVMADPTRIKQVMINLGINAGHAMRKNSGVLEIELRRENLSRDEAYDLSPDLEAGPYVRIVVRDTGEGMDKKTLERIFEPFFTTKKKGEGSGLGLSVVHGIVREHGGAVTVWSRPGRGSVFSVLLPAMEENEEAAGRNPSGGMPR